MSMQQEISTEKLSETRICVFMSHFIPEITFKAYKALSELTSDFDDDSLIV